MEFLEFEKLVELKKIENPTIFEINSCEVVGYNEILDFEKMLEVKLPSAYIEFLKNFGAGYFLFTIVYSVVKTSEWNVLDKDNTPIDFLCFSDNGCGDMYGFLVVDNLCSDEVYIVDNESFCPESCSWEFIKTEFNDMFEYLVVHGLRERYRWIMFVLKGITKDSLYNYCLLRSIAYATSNTICVAFK